MAVTLDIIADTVNFERDWRRLSTFMMAFPLQSKGFVFNWEEILAAIPDAESTIQELRSFADYLLELPGTEGKRVLPLGDTDFLNTVKSLAESAHIGKIQRLIMQQVGLFLGSTRNGANPEA